MISLYNRGMGYPEAQAMDEYPAQRNGDRLSFQVKNWVIGHAFAFSVKSVMI